jgi:sugar PTS system EIIA component
MTPPLTVLAPVAGTVVAMADVPDPVFAGEIVGPGLAIDPSRDGTVVVVSPISGTVAKLHPHAFVIQADDRRGALVHLGLDTVQLGGEGFTLHATEGAAIEAGDDVISWDPGQVEAGGRSPICPVVALQGLPDDVTPLAEVGSTVDAGDPLLEWR